MKLRINLNHIYIAIFASFFFFWGVNLNFIVDLEFLNFDSKSRNFLTSFKLSYLIVILIIPILYKFIKEKSLSPNIIFNYQKYIIFLVIFVTAHFFLIKIYYNEIIDKSEILNLSYLLLLSSIFCHFRNFIFVNFKKIIIVYLVIFIIYSIYEGSHIYNVGFLDGEGVLQFINLGQCSNDIFLIDILKKYLNISLSNSVYLENSHLAMMTVAIFFSSLYILFKEIKNNVLFLLFSLLFFIVVIIALNNLSTTFFVALLISQITLLFFFAKKINIKYWIVAFLFIFFNSYLFLVDRDCTKKVTDFSIKDIAEERLQKGEKNLTTLIYQRSIIVAKKTLSNHSLGWGIDGMDNATNSLLSNFVDCDAILLTNEHINDWNDNIDMSKRCNHSIPNNVGGYNDPNATFWLIIRLNLKDGLSNFFKLFTEFGIFAFILYFYFLKYILNIKNINSYNIFIIVLFITMSIRGAGYISGGFIFCLLEFFYYEKFSQNEHKK